MLLLLMVHALLGLLCCLNGIIQVFCNVKYPFVQLNSYIHIRGICVTQCSCCRQFQCRKQLSPLKRDYVTFAQQCLLWLQLILME